MKVSPKDIRIFLPLRALGEEFMEGGWRRYLGVWAAFFGVAWAVRGFQTEELVPSLGIGLFLLFLFVIAWLTTQMCFILLFRNPKGFIGGVGVLSFAMMIVANVGKWQAGYLTEFQEPLALPVALADLAMILVIGFLGLSSWRPWKGMLAVTFLIAFNLLFLNMLTIPSGVETWSDFLPFVYLASALDVLIAFAMLLKPKPKKRK